MNISRMVETTLFRRILVVTRLAHCVALRPSYDSLSPPTVMRTQWVLAMLGLMDTTIFPYVTLLPAGTDDLCMKKKVLVPLTRFPTPCAKLSILLENAVVQVPLSGTRISCVYSWVFPMAGSKTPWKETANSPTSSTVWLDQVRHQRG